MKFMQQYPKVMDKEVGCNYNYADQPIQPDLLVQLRLLQISPHVILKFIGPKFSIHIAITTIHLPNWKHTHFNDNIHIRKTKLNIDNNLPAWGLQTTSSSVVCTKLILPIVHVTGDVAERYNPKNIRILSHRH